jgi:uncharacterized membrane protein
MNKILKIIVILLTLIYPFIVFVALQKQLSLKFMSLFLTAIILINFIKSKQKITLAFGLLLSTLLYITNNDLFLKSYPVIMNLIITITFYASLSSTPIITQITQKMKLKQTNQTKIYTKNLTIIWTIFLAINTVISFTTLFLSPFVWTLYNGLISYLLMGILFIGEFCIRRRFLNV